VELMGKAKGYNSSHVKLKDGPIRFKKILSII
jgi:hypothetical protein